jgi:transcriptional regulator with XRE-family HTH domain
MDMKTRIKELCSERGISMNRLEEELSFGKGYISKLNSSVPNTANIKKISDYFGVSVDYLMGLDKTIVPMGATAGLSSEYIEVVVKARNEGFSPGDIELALDMLRMARKK